MKKIILTLLLAPMALHAAPFLAVDVPLSVGQCAAYVDAQPRKIIPARFWTEVNICVLDLAGYPLGTRVVVIAPIIHTVEQPKMSPRRVIATSINRVKYYAVAEVSCTTACVLDSVVPVATVITN